MAFALCRARYRKSFSALDETGLYGERLPLPSWMKLPAAHLFYIYCRIPHETPERAADTD